ncbi:MAG TPA: AMP-binding protein [Ktedonobacterales bacterium]|nr:AMP-binding protein [Ktedonobacterales bacterium]
MFETGIRQFRLAMSMVWGSRINPRNLERLIEDALKTLEEFGTPGDDVQQLLDGPFSDPKARIDFQNRALQRTARRLARVSPYYSKLFSSQGINPATITVENIQQLPVTLKQALQEQQQDFLATDTRPAITTRTTGTTGRPAEIWLSQYELDLWPALSALSGLLRNEISPKDCMQINISSRATAAVQMNIQTCRLAGARTRVLGIIPPDESLDSLLNGGEEAPTLLSTYPSYLAQLVQAARRRKLGPSDFHLRRIDCGGEVLSSALQRAAQETLGAERVNDIFGMTEILPVSGRVCNQGHLHQDLNIGFIEVISLNTGEPAKPGELGTMVVTPYYPYRECMPVFRYDTRDVVRQLSGESLSCNLAGIPATTRILGKADHMLRLHEQVVTMRDLVEVYEMLPSRPWPARFSAQVNGDAIDLVVPEQALEGMTKDEFERHFRVAGIPVRLASGVIESEVSQLRPLRADLLETTFAGRRN